MNTKVPYILVIGGANIDIVGKPAWQLVPEDSNPGTISISCGGVARNIAENLVRLGLKAKLLTAYGSDSNGDLLEKNCLEIGIDIAHALKSKIQPTSTYLSVLEQSGEMHVAISDMGIMDLIDLTYIEERAALIRDADYVIVDTNLPQPTLDYLVTHFKASRLILDTVSTHKALKAKELLYHFYAIKPNLKEAEALLGVSLQSEVAIKKALVHLHALGVTYPLISLGSKGVAFLDGDELIIHKTPRAKVVNSNGAGDAFIAAMTYAMVQGYDLKRIVGFACAAASVTLESESTMSPNMSTQTVTEKLEVNQ